MPSPAVFLDRDDTLVRCTDLPAPPPPAAPGDLIDPDLVELLPGARDACARLADAGFTLVVVTNQGTVARGGADLRAVERVNQRLRELVGRDSSGRWLLASFYFCPYHPKVASGPWAGEHPWRKPAPGMILTAARELNLDLSRSWLVGDADRDIEAGLAAGLGTRCLKIGGVSMRIPSLSRAADLILSP